MDLGKDIFTTFEAANICNANVTSIKNWIEQGEIEAFRTPGGHYRIERAHLDGFLRRHKMPNPFEDAAARRILLVHRDDGLTSRMKTHFGARYEYVWTQDLIEGVLALGCWSPRLFVLDARLPRVDAAAVCGAVRRREELAGLRILVVTGEGEPVGPLRAAGADEVVTSDTDAALFDALESYLS